MNLMTPNNINLGAEFPIKERFAFMNNSSVAPIPASTQAAIVEFARDAAEEGPANYIAWLRSMAETRESSARLVNTSPDNICFVKNTTHGVLVIANSINWREGDNVVGLAHEFPANVHPWRNLSEVGVEFRMVPEQKDYTYNIDDIAAQMDSRTRLLAISWVEYSTGVRNDLAAISQLCQERGVMLLVDAIQGLGAIRMDLSKYSIDFLTCDGHKWLIAPEGCGILYVNPLRIGELNHRMCGWCGLKSPSEYDRYDQDYKDGAKRFEEGSHNLMNITALGASLRLILDIGTEWIEQRIEALTNHLITGLDAKGYTVVTPRDFERRAGIVSFSKEGVDPFVTAQMLEREHKVQVAARRGFFRASPHFYNDEDEIARLIKGLP